MNSSGEDRNAAQGTQDLFCYLIKSVDPTKLAEIQTKLAEMVERYPELACQISAMLPVRLPMEGLSESSAGATGSPTVDNPAALGAPVPRLGDYQIVREMTMKLGETSDSTGVTQAYQGFVDAVHDGMAYLTLETTGGHYFELEWDAAELAAQSIGERQPFTLQTVTTADTMRFKFTPDPPQPLPSQLLQEIDDLTNHYRATGELRADGE